MTDTNETKVQAQSEAQVQEEPAIQLTLTPEEKKQENEAQLKALEEEQNAKMEAVAKDIYSEAKLSDAEKKMVEDFSQKIDITEANIVLQYGSEAQKKISDFSDTALDNVKTKDLGEVGTLLSNLVVELKGFDEKENDKGFLGIFKKAGNKVESLKAKYDKTEVNVNKIANVLEDHQIQLLKDIALLDQLYDRNQTNCKELTMYIIAGKKKLEKVRNEDLPALQAKAKESGLAEDAQAANDLQNACDRFEKKLYDLELTRQVSIQMAPQIRLVQNNDTLMTEKIQSTLVNTIPLWKNQMVLALGVSHSREAMQAEREVNNMTNELLKKNAETLHQATVETAKESERGIVDLETLQHTNQELIATLDEVLQIQKEGHAKRAEAEKELARIESELHNKLLEINR
ncbi:MAG: toxic anion resistance protein [Bulleidia sp.]|nr:toxic anion resistance protein [Bulleidia sp.]